MVGAEKARLALAGGSGGTTVSIAGDKWASWVLMLQCVYACVRGGHRSRKWEPAPLKSPPSMWRKCHLINQFKKCKNAAQLQANDQRVVILITAPTNKRQKQQVEILLMIVSAMTVRAAQYYSILRWSILQNVFLAVN